ncbi:MAG: acyltransferase [Burkholderiales bacterium]|nr:acyltransferase [Burkholderiales bacterium]
MTAGSSAHETSTDPAIELVRGGAAAMVVAAHALPAFGGGASFGYTGVDLFFVLSGFVFAPYLYGKALQAPAFFVRRGFRLYPLYLVALMGYVALHRVHGQPADHLWQHLLLLHTWQDAVIGAHYNPAFWSLPPEIEFYLLLPLLARLPGTDRKVLALMLAALLLRLGIVAGKVLLPAQAGLWLVLSAHVPSVMVEFLFGALAWRAVQGGGGSAGRRVLLSVAGLALLAGAAGLFQLSQRPAAASGVPQALALAMGCTDLLAAAAYALILAGAIGLLRGLALRLGTMAFVAGNLSFGVYLVHNGVIMVLQGQRATHSLAWLLAVCVGACLVLAAGLHWAVEAPMRRWGRRLASGLERRHRQGVPAAGPHAAVG